MNRILTSASLPSHENALIVPSCHTGWALSRRINWLGERRQWRIATSLAPLHFFLHSRRIVHLKSCSVNAPVPTYLPSDRLELLECLKIVICAKYLGANNETGSAGIVELLRIIERDSPVY